MSVSPASCRMLAHSNVRAVRVRLISRHQLPELKDLGIMEQLLHDEDVLGAQNRLCQTPVDAFVRSDGFRDLNYALSTFILGPERSYRKPRLKTKAWMLSWLLLHPSLPCSSDLRRP